MIPLRSVSFYILYLCLCLVTAMPCVQAFEVSSDYMMVQQTFLKEDFNQTSVLAENYVRSFPHADKTKQVWLWWVLSLDRIGETETALRRLGQLKKKLKSTDKIWPEVLYWEGQMSSNAQDMVRARTAYQKLLEQYPETSWSAQAQLGLGVAYLKQQAYTRAMPYFKDLVKQQPNTSISKDARLFIGLCAYQMKRYWETVAVFNALLKETTDPQRRAQIAFYLGEAQRELNNTSKARLAYRQGLATKADSRFVALSAFALGWSDYQAKACSTAVSLFDQFLSAGVSENQAEAYYAKAECLTENNQKTEAIALYEKVVSEFPESVVSSQASFRLSAYWFDEGDMEQSHKWLEALAQNDLDEEAEARRQLHLGKLFLHQGKSTSALKAYESIQDIQDIALRQAAFNGTADTYLYLRQYKEAKNFYNRTVDLAPGSEQAGYAIYQMGRLYLEQQQWSEAKQHFEDLLKDPTSGLQADAQLAMALMALAQNQDILAKEQFKHLMAQRPKSAAAAKARYYMGLLTLDAGDADQAQKLFEETIAQVPNSEEAVESRIILVEIGYEGSSVAELEMLAHQVHLPASQRASLAQYVADRALSEMDYVKAIRWYETAIDLNPATEGQFVYHMAEAYEAGGDIKRALHLYEYIQTFPWRVRARFAAAKLYERQGQIDSVIQLYESLIGESIPEVKVVQERLDRLYAERKDNKE